MKRLLASVIFAAVTLLSSASSALLTAEKVTISSSYQASAPQDDELYIYANAASGALTVTLPSPFDLEAQQKIYIIKTDASANAVTANSTSTANLPASTINGNASIALSSKNQVAVFTANGLNWGILDQTGGPILATSASSNCLSIGPNGTTNAALSIDCSASSAATGFKITSNASGSGSIISGTSPNSSDNATFASSNIGFAMLGVGANPNADNTAVGWNGGTGQWGVTLGGQNIITATGFGSGGATNIHGTLVAAGLGTVTPGTNGAICASSSGQIGANTANCIASLLEYKEHITLLIDEDALSEVGKLARDAISYRYTDAFLGAAKSQPHAHDLQVGFGAELVERDDPRLAQYNGGKLSGVRYEQMTAIEAVAIEQLRRECYWLRIGVGLALLFSVFGIYRTFAQRL